MARKLRAIGLSTLLRDTRKARGHSTRKAAGLIGISQSKVSQIETRTGASNLTLDTLMGLAGYLGVDLARAALCASIDIVCGNPWGSRSPQPRPRTHVRAQRAHRAKVL